MESELQSQRDSKTALEAKFENLVSSQGEQSTPRQTRERAFKTQLLCVSEMASQHLWSSPVWALLSLSTQETNLKELSAMKDPDIKAYCSFNNSVFRDNHIPCD